MDNNKAVFELEFNKDNFVNSINEAIKSTNNLDASLQEVSNTSKGVNFSKPISELSKFEASVKDIFKAMQSNSKQTNSEIDKSVNEIVKSEKKIKQFLSELKTSLSKSTDKAEFRDLRKQINLTENALRELSGEEVVLEQKTQSAKARLREMKAEMIALEDAGLDDSAMFHKLTIESAKLTDQLGDQSEKIRVLSSDTYKLDAGVDVIKQMANAWGIAEGAVALFGGENEEIQKSMQRLIAIQTVANGLQEISTFLTGQSAGMVAIKSGYNKILAVTEEAVASATILSANATKVFSKALIATGIGAFIVGLGLLIAYWDDLSGAITGATESTKAIEQAQEDVKGSVADVTASVAEQNALFDLANKGQISRKEALEKYNETFGDTLGIAKNYNEAESLFIAKSNAYIQSVKQRELATAFFKIAAQKQVDSELNKTKKGLSVKNKVIALVIGGANGAALGAVSESQDRVDAYNEEVKSIEEINKLGEKALSESFNLQNKFNINLDGKKGDKKPSAKKEIENIYKELKEGFQSDLKAINDADLQGLSRINAEANKNTIERNKKVSEALKDGKLTKVQAKDLRRLIGLVEKTELETEIKKFNEERNNALVEFSKSNQSVENELVKLRIENLKDGYEKEVKLIKLEELVKNDAIENSRFEAIKKLDELKKSEFINEERYQQELVNLNKNYDGIKIQNFILNNSKLQEANKKRLQGLRDVLESDFNVYKSEQEVFQSEEIKRETENYNAGLITEAGYQKNIKEIKDKYSKEIRDERISEIDKSIEIINKQIETEIDAIKKGQLEIQKNVLIKEKNEVEAIAPLTFIEKFFGGKDEAKATQDLIKETFDVALNLIKEQQQAELDAYDQAIKLQQDRVTEAQKIAEAGNTEYLREEKDRLAELEAKREASARRQIEINTAIQASQILVAVAGAAAQIAAPGATIAQVVAAITTVIGAIGTGASLVAQGNSSQPRLYDGTEYLERGNNPKGRDTIPAMLHEGERIVPSYINEKLKGIPNIDLPKLVDGSLFNYNFVNAKALPKENNNLENRLKNLEALQSENNEYLKKLSINVTMDSEGFATSISTMLDNQKKIRNA
jgi:hypothetical protein